MELEYNPDKKFVFRAKIYIILKFITIFFLSVLGLWILSICGRIVWVRNHMQSLPVVKISDMNESDITAKGLEPPFAVDAVYTWAGEKKSNDIRFRDNHELQFSLRSLAANMEWIRSVFVIVPDDCSVPSWMDLDQVEYPANKEGQVLFFLPGHARFDIIFIKQSSIFKNRDDGVGNRNSESIEVNLHRITSLSKHFIYFCDDFFVARPLSYLFFYSEDMSRIRTPEVFVAPQVYSPFYARDFLRQDKVYPLYKCPEALLKFQGSYPPLVQEYYFDHQPRALTKDIFVSLEAEYPEWFDFVSSHKRRFNSCAPGQLSDERFMSEEAIWKVITVYES